MKLVLTFFSIILPLIEMKMRYVMQQRKKPPANPGGISLKRIEFESFGEEMILSNPPLIHGSRQFHQSCNSSMCPTNNITLEGKITFTFDCCNINAFLECFENRCICWGRFPGAYYNSTLMKCIVPPQSECPDFKNDDVSMCPEDHGCYQNCEKCNDTPRCHKCPEVRSSIIVLDSHVISNIEEVCYMPASGIQYKTNRLFIVISLFANFLIIFPNYLYYAYSN